MTYFADLSPYTYWHEEPGALNVGWLDVDHAFEVEAPSEAVLDALWLLLKNPVNQTRGVHECEICPRDPDFLEKTRELHRRAGDPADPLHHVPLDKIPWPDDARMRSIQAHRGGETLLIGSAEVRVFAAAGVTYAAPTLVYHYMREHHYKPPAEFVRALQGG